MEPLFSIGEMAKKSQLSIQRLRYYDKIGLLVPAFTDPTSGYRYYKTAQEEQLNLIQALQYMGFSLQELKQYLDKNTSESLPDLLIKYQQKLMDEEARIARKKWLIDRYQGLLKRETDSAKPLTAVRLLLTEPLLTPVHADILNDPAFHQEVQKTVSHLGLSKSYQQFPGYCILDGQTYLFIELDHSIGAPGERRLLSSERQAFVTPQNWETPLENENYLLQETVAWINQELVRGYSYETKLTFE
ncbi:MerR family transcriptional regulator [Listeria monocytogenes]|uniref:MerR family transcriptional regulator n=1 Tax=Listeria monocytogenes TaxID=1639 RepID=UPI000854A130|nr:helix-turn-helix domain-containing protein [Listeria monocytogenes]EAC4202702.1 MerR family transcriptional regulator [Listeria monocytogenes]EAD2777825.1 MerR family transcriptional regulator [Listeria monocytogenes]EAD7000880.1 MerR family transcriptional regulator [Listeria monocytogenes]EAE3608582.1 MerR family transcriptional regulator [Listeria monocytogenes]EAE3633604.1 MerR family transcriptional regulator [Listeria monocytogenes]